MAYSKEELSSRCLCTCARAPSDHAEFIGPVRRTIGERRFMNFGAIVAITGDKREAKELRAHFVRSGERQDENPYRWGVGSDARAGPVAFINAAPVEPAVSANKNLQNMLGGRGGSAGG